MCAQQQQRDYLHRSAVSSPDLLSKEEEEEGGGLSSSSREITAPLPLRRRILLYYSNGLPQPVHFISADSSNDREAAWLAGYNAKNKSSGKRNRASCGKAFPCLKWEEEEGEEEANNQHC